MTLEDVTFSLVGEFDDAEDVMRCVKNIILTPAGTVPLPAGSPGGHNRDQTGLTVQVMQFEPQAESAHSGKRPVVTAKQK